MPIMKPAFALAASLFAFGAVPASAQEGPTDPGQERVNLVIVYGDDACPQSNGGDIVVCARKGENERYRIPEPLRGDPNAPANQAWGERAKSIEYVGRSGTESCSPTGAGGATGCFTKLANLAKAERKQADNVSWRDLVAAERAKRLSTIDADSEAIEKRVRAEEAAEAKGNAAASSPAADTTSPPAPQ
jgi:hypothetical protein